ncbi:MAG: RnfABCDGE type electron transport complex subunit D [Gemmatimonadota bacterium]|nr:MAG: RnfABCDGE type electron transport complex subunit D [Gemmatimonadota bacterium]
MSRWLPQLDSTITRMLRLSVAVGPHWKKGGTLQGMQARWLIALAPAVAASLYYFGFGALRVLSLAILFSLLADVTVERFAPSKDRTSNWTSVTFAVMLALFMPLGTPWWLVLAGCVLMIVIGKKLFGGYGGYPVHPVLAAVAMLELSWPARLDSTRAMIDFPWAANPVEPTRFAANAGGGVEALYPWQDLFVGLQVAGIGNAMVVFLLAGGLFLVLIREVPWQLPLSFVAGLLVTSLVVAALGDPGEFPSPLFFVLTGSVAYGAFFFVTDHTTSPVGSLAMVLYGLLAGMLVMLIRAFSVHHDGVVFGVLLASLAVPLLDRISKPVVGLEAGS